MKKILSRFPKHHLAYFMFAIIICANFGACSDKPEILDEDEVDNFTGYSAVESLFVNGEKFWKNNNSFNSFRIETGYPEGGQAFAFNFNGKTTKIVDISIQTTLDGGYLYLSDYVNTNKSFAPYVNLIVWGWEDNVYQPKTYYCKSGHIFINQVNGEYRVSFISTDFADENQRSWINIQGIIPCY